MDTVNEFAIEWIKGDNTATVTAPTSTRLKGQVMRLAEKYPDEVEVTDVNKDGSIVAHVPVKWVNIRHPRKISDEQKEASRIRFQEMWADKKEQDISQT